MNNFPEYLEALANQDCREAFKLAVGAVQHVQSSLRVITPDNPLLELVDVPKGLDRMSFGRNFTAVMKNNGVESSNNWYYAIGRYVEMLREEVKVLRQSC